MKPHKKHLHHASIKFLSGRGCAEPRQEFSPSPFQLEAVDAVLQSDTVVVAPTGSGKTYIAVEAMKFYLQKGEISWYTTPLKALSNQKLTQFQKIFGGENVGLVTGERQENRSAPIIVATTEILRNLLYEGGQPPAFVVLDEAHYLGDEQRGTTWEEIVILAPGEVRFLLLSATIPNAGEFCAWMETVRPRKPALVRCTERPVPLRYGFLDLRQLPLPLHAGVPEQRQKFPKLYPRSLVHTLEQHNLLPAIIFLPTRKKCDHWASAFRNISTQGAKERKELHEKISSLYPQLVSHPLRHIFVFAGVAPHHAGHLTPWRILIEHALEQGLLRAVFATTTLAAGLDVPARTVVLSQLWRFDAHGSENINSTEFHQMTGRAGRRGMDKVGFVFVLPETGKDFSYATLLKNSSPEPVRSAFRLHYFQLLNLLSHYAPEEIRAIFLKKSFFAFQMLKRKKFPADILNRDFSNRLRLLRELGYVDEHFKLTPEGQWAKGIRHEYSLYITENIRAGKFQKLSPELFCSICAVFISQKTGKPRLYQKFLDISPFLQEIQRVQNMEKTFHIPVEPFVDARSFLDIQMRAQCVYGWAHGQEWASLLEETSLWEGDLQRLIFQTEELLHQISELPVPAAETARRGRRLLLRPPVYE